MGFAQRQQAELAKQIMIQKARMEKVIKDLKADVGTKIDRAREEVFTVAYTSLERTFGEQSEEMLMGIDHGVQLVLKDFDERYWRMADFKLRGGLNGKQFHVKKHNWDEPTQEEANLVIAVRDEIIDVMAQFIEEFIESDKDKVKAWVEALLQDPELEPFTIIANAKNRRRQEVS